MTFIISLHTNPIYICGMNLVISDEKTIAAIQEDFHSQFPFLKIDFFQKGKGHIRMRIPAASTFGTIGTKSHKNITVTPSMTVAELEKLLLNWYGLYVQIMRKSGKAWLETTKTDDWSLQEQNEQGKALSS